MRILFIGDLVGKPGRIYLQENLPAMKRNIGADLVIANAENAAGGAGITERVFNEIRNCGVDLLTGGNHIWDQKEVYNFIDREERLLRPANYPVQTTPGRGSLIIRLRKGRLEVAVINLIGRVFMRAVDCPFRAADRELEMLQGRTPIILVDFHAEATSEKQAMGWYLNGKVSAVIGTHSHVQTADERILSKGTAYISDVGMVGLYDSILGVNIAEPLQMFLTQQPKRLSIGKGLTLFNACLIEIDDSSGKAISIERIKDVK